MLTACAGPQPKAVVEKEKSSEYFAESEYGVKASPRVAEKRSRLPRGGGRDQTGKPYQVRGKWYYPKEDPDYRKVGAASWYGDAFHGRLTANGEIYDMTHLTAAHPTMPLPSYARVTNMANGSSVIVRVNDRGPFAHGRIIDLSKRAAEMLDYASAGVAEVQVEYVGRAPLHGHDEQYLMASYEPGRQGPAEETAPPVMIAMNGPTPAAALNAAAAAFPVAVSASDPVLPAFGPIGPERPMIDFAVTTAAMSKALTLSYADQRLASASEAFAAVAGSAIDAGDVIASWKRQRGPTDKSFIAAGTFHSREEAEHQRRKLSSIGLAEVEPVRADGLIWYSVNLHADGRLSGDEMLRAAWASGATEAILVRD